MSGQRCTQPGCTGTVEDGYCDTCGMAPVAASGAPAGRSPAPAGEIPAPTGGLPAPGAGPAASGSAVANGAPCAQPGCSGTVQDGYCDVCGTPADAAPGALAPTVTPPTARPTSTPARRTGVGAIPDGGACREPGCDGTMADGYCDVCGTPADESGQSAEGTAASSRTVGTSSRLASTALGSARAAQTGSVSTRRTTTSSQRLRSQRLGGGITMVPPAPEIDATKALLDNPVVPENKRFCPKCGEKVGRGRDGQPGRTEGFCPKCRHPFSFNPKLAAGDLVAGQYEVAGCLAHGGLGWIYLARDRNVSDRWVVLKGLLNSADPDALAAAIAEQRFLAQVSHPNIVEIYNFVTHEDAGYIVMEYVGGTSLKSMLKQRMQAAGGKYDPLPVDQALAYILELLPAFQYLHDVGLVFCDFKPDNVIQVGDAVKLIDLGGVRRIDDDDSAIFGTLGYQAPEVAELGTSVPSDIYTIGRTLVVLTMEFRGYQTTYADTLPAQSDSPVFTRYDAFYRLVAKCCARNRDDRFVSADELRNQMVGVMREVVAFDSPDEAAVTTSTSLLFEPPTAGTDPDDWRNLPRLRVDPHDPQVGWLQSLQGSPLERLAALGRPPGQSSEVQLAIARTGLEADKPEIADAAATRLLQLDPWEWRAVWVQGLAALARKDWAAARASFNAVYGQVPGELAPKLALAFACENAGDLDVAETLYSVCARTDAAYVPMAAFGLARVRAKHDDVDAAVAAYQLVPAQSSSYRSARSGLAQLLASTNRGLPDLVRAYSTLDETAMSAGQRASVKVDIYREALTRVERQGPEPSVLIGQVKATDTGLRSGLEGALRELATHTSDAQRRIELVDQANTVRPWSLW